MELAGAFILKCFRTGGAVFKSHPARLAIRCSLLVGRSIRSAVHVTLLLARWWCTLKKTKRSRSLTQQKSCEINRRRVCELEHQRNKHRDNI